MAKRKKVYCLSFMLIVVLILLGHRIIINSHIWMHHNLPVYVPTIQSGKLLANRIILLSAQGKGIQNRVQQFNKVLHDFKNSFQRQKIDGNVIESAFNKKEFDNEALQIKESQHQHYNVEHLRDTSNLEKVAFERSDLVEKNNKNLELPESNYQDLNYALNDFENSLQRHNSSVTIETPEFNLDNRDPQFIEKVAALKTTKIIALGWSGDATSEWSSIGDRENVVIQKYHVTRADEELCRAMEAGGRSKFLYEIIYNQTIECSLPNDFGYEKMQIHRLHSFHSFDENTKILPDFYLPPPLITYLIIFKDSIVTNIGDIYTSNIRLSIYGCLGGSNFPLFRNNINYHDHIFVIAQNWGSGHFHRSIEVLPRLASSLDFLRQNPDVKIHVPSRDEGLVKKSFEVLGLDPRRMISGWARAGLIYLPKPSACGAASILEIQLLAGQYSTYINNIYPHLDRNKLVFIKRRRRNFENQAEIINVLKSLSQAFDLDLRIFDDQKLPKLNETMKLFNEARVVVGPHGAGFSNMVFSRPGTLIVEGLYDMWRANLCFENLAYGLGMRYHALLSEEGGRERLIRVSPSRILRVLLHYLRGNNI